MATIASINLRLDELAASVARIQPPSPVVATQAELDAIEGRIAQIKAAVDAAVGGTPQ